MIALSIYCVAVLSVLTVIYYKWTYGFWARLKVPHLQGCIPFGNLGNPLRRTQSISLQFLSLYKRVKEMRPPKGGNSCYPGAGIYLISRPAFLCTSPDLIKCVLTKDFKHFVTRGLYYNEKSDPLSAHLFSVDGAKWRELRPKLTPTFTTGKLKTMLGTLVECTGALNSCLDEYCASGDSVPIKEILGHFTTDVIGSCAFGLDCKSFEDANSPFRHYGKRIFHLTFRRNVRLFFTTNMKAMCRWLGVPAIDRDVSTFFTGIVRKTMDYRRRNNVERSDFLQLLLDTRTVDGHPLTFEEISAQCFVFFLAGFETSSTLMTFTLFELCQNPTIQQRLRQECGEVLGRHDDTLSYEALQEMHYLQQVLDESLRKYPPVPLLTRLCVDTYKFPVNDDEEWCIPKGTSVSVPVMALHYDEEYYPEPERFDPERFSDQVVHSRHPYTFLPFGEGPRNCIGLRFGLMQAKVGIVTLLRKYRFTLDAERTKLPISFDPNSFVLNATGGIWLKTSEI